MKPALLATSLLLGISNAANAANADGYKDVSSDDYYYKTPTCKRGKVNMFYGSSHDIPRGWIECDGSKDTPDFRDRFPVAAGKEFPYFTSGGSSNIYLSVDQLPSHKHALSGANIATSYGGKHIHAASADIAEGGDHEHDAGQLGTDKAGSHSHAFNAESDEGGHGHKYDLQTSISGDHIHKFDVTTLEAGEHSHDNDIAVTTEGSSHGHDIDVKVDEVDDHKHDVLIDHFDIVVDDHVHGVGSLSVEDHKPAHYHNIAEATTDKAGQHDHKVKSDLSLNGNHVHGFDLNTDTQPNHDHEAGDLTTGSGGEHFHNILEQKTDKDGDHDHEFDAYLEQTYDTKQEDRGFGVALDAVDGSLGYKITVSEDDGHNHVIPATTAKTAGNHSHDIDGKTEISGKHYHDVVGDIVANGDHFHQINTKTSKDGKHSHLVFGGTDAIEVTLGHKISGSTGQAGGFTKTVKDLIGATKDKGAHSHDAQAKTTSDGAHDHALTGGIKADGKHVHNINDKTKECGDHSHIIQGTIGGEDNGAHNHAISGETALSDTHSHTIKGNTAKDGDHSHDVEIYLRKAGKHKHKISGETEITGQGKAVEINPPYVAVFFVCCVGLENDDYFDGFVTTAYPQGGQGAGGSGKNASDGGKSNGQDNGNNDLDSYGTEDTDTSY